MKNLNKFAFVIIFSLLVSFSPIAPKHGQAFWGEFVQEVFHFGLDELFQTMRGMLRGMMKQQAAESLDSMVNNLVGGSGGSATFITNWGDYLVKQPQNNAKIFLNDYLSQVTAGRGSFAGYQAEGFFGSGTGSYFSTLAEGAKGQIENNLQISPTLETNPSQMFENGNFKAMETYLSGVNNPWAFNIAAENFYEEKLTEETLTNQTQSIAYQGFIGTGSDQAGKGDITFPGILSKENIANIQNIPNMSLATATSMGEVISTVISKTMTRSMQQGFSSVQGAIQKNVNNVQNRINSTTSNIINQAGPGARFDLPARN